MTDATRADRFVFGWCNACERYACGETSEGIRATPTRDSTATSQAEAFAVMAGVHAALAAVIDGSVTSALATARSFKVNARTLAELKSLALSA